MSTRLAVLTFLVVLGTVGLQGNNTGKKIDNFTLQDYNGMKHSLTDYKSSKAIVLMFIATKCPVSNAYNERMEQLYKEYSKRGIAFVAINSNKAESVAEIKAHALEHGFSFSILKDENNNIADQLSASVTPEIFVLNGKFEVLYHGRIDDSRRESDVKSQDLKSALDEILDEKPVAITETKAFGCSIKRIR